MNNDPHALPAGTVIAGYRIVRVLGAGGFGITYEGESPVTGRRVAIKEFFPRGIASRKGATEIIYAERDTELVSWALKRFESSTTEQCRLKHPNIVEVFHYLAENDTGYMFMDYVEGTTLEQWLRDRPNLPSEDELRLFIEPVIDALDYLHSMNFIHRDIAPDNIMITADGRPVIIDFGAIKLIESRTLLQAKTVHSFMVGKQHYSPPEQTREGEVLDVRVDIYSLGAVLYRAFTGTPPADTEERARRIAFGEGDPLTPLSQSAPHVRPELAKAIERALSFRASERPGSIEEFRASVGWQGTAAASAPTRPVIRSAVTPPSRPGPHSAFYGNTPPNPSYISAAGQTGKRPAVARWAAVAAALLLLVVGSAYAMMSLRSGEPQAANVTAPAKTETPGQSQQVVSVEQPKAKTQPKTETPVMQAPPPDPQAEARRDFELAQKVDTMEAYDLFLTRHSEGFYATLARAQKTKLAMIEEQRVKDEQLRIHKLLVFNVVAELQGAGCGPDDNEGEWNDAARNSLALYNRHARTKFDGEPNEGMLNALKQRSGRVCPLTCKPGFAVRNNACVAVPKQVQRPQPQPQQQQQQQPAFTPRGSICVRGICVGN